MIKKPPTTNQFGEFSFSFLAKLSFHASFVRVSVSVCVCISIIHFVYAVHNESILRLTQFEHCHMRLMSLTSPIQFIQTENTCYCV